MKIIKELDIDDDKKENGKFLLLLTIISLLILTFKNMLFEPEYYNSVLKTFVLKYPIEFVFLIGLFGLFKLKYNPTSFWLLTGFMILILLYTSSVFSREHYPYKDILSMVAYPLVIIYWLITHLTFKGQKK